MAVAGGKRKYKLAKAEEGGERSCAFFDSAAGCRTGSACKFSHSLNKPTSRPAEVEASKPEEVPAAAPKAHKKVKTTTEPQQVAEEAPAANGGAPAATTSTRPKSKRKRARESKRNAEFVAKQARDAAKQQCLFFKQGGCLNGETCAYSHAAAAPAATAPAPAPAPVPAARQAPATTTGGGAQSRPSSAKPKAKQQKAAKPKQPVVSNAPEAVAARKAQKAAIKAQRRSSSSSLLAGLPISPFLGNGVNGSSAPATPEAPKTYAPDPIHPDTDKWQRLVEATQSHASFSSKFTFPADDASWVKPPPCGDRCPGELPQVLAMDCEMCMSQDPVSGEKNGKELVRLSVIDATTDDVLLDTLVKPTWEIADMRTFVHGIAQNQLDPVQFTLRHAQAAMMKICCPNTIIIGHALHNDLESLKLSHTRVVDTACLFRVENKGPTATASLRDVVKSVLGEDIQQGKHDSVADARSTLAVALHRLKNEAEGLQSIRATPKPEADPSFLLVHRIPAGGTQELLTQVFQSQAYVVPEKVEAIEFGASGSGKAAVAFNSVEHAELAFATLPGKVTTDKAGKPQKKVPLDGASGVQGSVMVRKMLAPAAETEAGDAEASTDVAP